VVEERAERVVSEAALVRRGGRGLLRMRAHQRRIEVDDQRIPTGRPVFRVFGALAECERNLIRERTRAGSRRPGRGRTGGRPTVLMPAKARQAKRMLEEGTPAAEVATVLGVSRSTLYCRLSSSTD